jgi:hypothetical protein
VISLSADELCARAAKRAEWAWRALTAGAEDLRAAGVFEEADRVDRLAGEVRELAKGVSEP